MKSQFTILFFVLTLVLSTTNCLHSASLLKVKDHSGPWVFVPSKWDVLGRAYFYAVLAGSSTTNTGATTVHGSIGVSPGTAISGTAVTLIWGSLLGGDTFSLAAQGDLTKSYNFLAGLPSLPANNLTGQDLKGKILPPGVYKFDVAGGLTAGVLKLDANGDYNAQWIFQFGSTFITEVGAQVEMINGGNPMNVFWQVGSSAVIKNKGVMVGNIVAHTSITLAGETTLRGRALARAGGVTMDRNVVNSSYYWPGWYN